MQPWGVRCLGGWLRVGAQWKPEVGVRRPRPCQVGMEKFRALDGSRPTPVLRAPLRGLASPSRRRGGRSQCIVQHVGGSTPSHALSPQPGRLPHRLGPGHQLPTRRQTRPRGAPEWERGGERCGKRAGRARVLGCVVARALSARLDPRPPGTEKPGERPVA